MPNIWLKVRSTIGDGKKYLLLIQTISVRNELFNDSRIEANSYRLLHRLADYIDLFWLGYPINTQMDRETGR